jgi:hypothetical protein
MAGGVGGRNRVGGAKQRAFGRPVGRPSRSVESLEKDHDEVCTLEEVLRNNLGMLENLLSKKAYSELPTTKASLREQLTVAKADLRNAQAKKSRLGRALRAKGRNEKLISCTCSFFWCFFQLIITSRYDFFWLRLLASTFFRDDFSRRPLIATTSRVFFFSLRLLLTTTSRVDFFSRRLLASTFSRVDFFSHLALLN